MFRYSVTIFLSAFLLFQIQPLIARLVLPQFGGTSAVWTTCLMFFQVVLLLGYLYVHGMRVAVSPRLSFFVHIVLLAVAAAVLRISAVETTTADPATMAWSIVKLLGLSIGLPFLALSTTGPLMQAWHSATAASDTADAGKTYRLYALSNLGSMLALVSYPFVFEPNLNLDAQQHFWSIGFYVFCGCVLLSGVQVIRCTQWQSGLEQGDASVESESTSSTVWGRAWVWMLWILLPTVASVLLMATTNTLCQEVASFPFLWILPLALYLLSLIICFDRPTWYRRRIFLPLLTLSVFIAVPLSHLGTAVSLLNHVVGMSAVIFFSAMVCHGELYRLRPHTSRLTAFYLCVAIGGGLGGVLVAVVAPRLFNGFYEFQIGLLLSLLVPLVIVVWEARTSGNYPLRWVWGYGVLASVAATFVGCSLAYYIDGQNHSDVLFRDRNAYGLVTVVQNDNYRVLVNGQTDHGGQFVDEDEQLSPSSYYNNGSGAAIAFQTMREARQHQSSPNLNVGIIGLGAGSLVTWGMPDDKYCFYEINPLVETVARDYFTYLKHLDAEIVIGDGRLELQRELDKQGPRNFDLLFIDAFSSDSIPMHLLTQECFELYSEHLNSDGILVAHISNKYIDLLPVLQTLARSQHLTPLLIDYYNPKSGTETRWVLMTSNQKVIDRASAEETFKPWPDDLPDIVWTDRFASLSPIVNWTGGVDWSVVFDRQHKRKKQESQSGK